MSYAPDEPSEAIFAEKTYLQGTVLTGVAYGALFMLYCICIHLLWARRRRGIRGSDIFLVYTTLILILNTLNLAGATSFAQLAFIDNRNYPGGPAQYENDFYFVTLNTMCNISYMLANWLGDALMLWRFWVIFRGSRRSSWLIMALPTLLFAGTFSMGVLLLIQLSSSSPWGSASNVNWIIPFFATSLAFNVVVTFAICGRLYYYRRSILSAMPGHSHGDQYTGIAAIVVESSLITSSFTLLCLVPLVEGSAVANLFLQPLGEIQAIATLLIVYRVAIGRGWSTETQAFLSTTVTSRDPESSMGTNGSRRVTRPMFVAMNSTTFTQTSDSKGRVDPSDVSFNGDLELKGLNASLPDNNASFLKE
ncbi:hypothetical protein PENSPDRAFT_629408 [Peniophora sp. CONT]|nr:hypothetical protein PENSPDRAFT_629408 [Peniophora sp. CONT]